MCHRQWEIRRELSIPAMDVPYFPSLRVVLPISCESLGTILAAKTPTPPRRELQPPALARGASRHLAGSPNSIFPEKIPVVHRVPESIRSCFPAFPLSQDCSSTHPMGCIQHQLLWEVSYNVFGLDHVPSHPLPLPALGCSQTLFAWPKIMNKMAWMTWTEGNVRLW